MYLEDMDFNKNVTLKDLINLGEDFDVEFELKTENKTTIFTFGKVKWGVPFGQDFDLYSYIKVSMLLSATYPKKVLQNYVR